MKNYRPTRETEILGKNGRFEVHIWDGNNESECCCGGKFKKCEEKKESLLAQMPGFFLSPTRLAIPPQRSKINPKNKDGIPSIYMHIKTTNLFIQFLKLVFLNN